MFLLQLGSERVPTSLPVLGAGDTVIRTPIYGVLVETAQELVLLVTGIGAAALADPAALTEIYGSGMHPWGPPGDPLVQALSPLGFIMADVTLAAVSHLHLDHTGGIPRLAAAGVPVAIHRAELDHGPAHIEQGTEREVAVCRDDVVVPGVSWWPWDGDEQLAPGVWAFSTPGHTPGHTSYKVDLAETGTWMFAADVADLGENLHGRVTCGSVAEPADAERALASIHWLVDEGARLGAWLVPGHDEVFLTAVWHPPGRHR